MTILSAKFAARVSRLLGLTILLAGPHAAFAQEIYKSVDKHGNVTFSDTKTHKKAETVKLPTINTQPAVKPTFNTQKKNTQNSPNYQIAILNPVNGDTLHNNQRSINVDVSISPALRSGLYLQAMLNGALHGAAGSSTRITVSDFNRGEQALSIAVIDSNGNIIAQSASITLYVKRPSLNSPARKARAQS